MLYRRDFLRAALAGTIALLFPNIPTASVVSKTKVLVDGLYEGHLVPVKISTDLGRSALFELGRKGVYRRFLEFPVDINAKVGGVS